MGSAPRLTLKKLIRTLERAEREAAEAEALEASAVYDERLKESIAAAIGDGPPAGSGVTPENWREWKLFGWVVCPARPNRRSKHCGSAGCSMGASCWRMADLGLTGDGRPIKRRRRVLCEARTRAGGFCRMRVEPGKGRCRLHGGLSTGPKTAEGKARCVEGTRRWRAWQRSEAEWRALNLELERRAVNFR